METRLPLRFASVLRSSGLRPRAQDTQVCRKFGPPIHRKAGGTRECDPRVKAPGPCLPTVHRGGSRGTHANLRHAETSSGQRECCRCWRAFLLPAAYRSDPPPRSEEHTSELQSLMRISYAVFCLTNKKKHH